MDVEQIIYLIQNLGSFSLSYQNFLDPNLSVILGHTGCIMDQLKNNGSNDNQLFSQMRVDFIGIIGMIGSNTEESEIRVRTRREQVINGGGSNIRDTRVMR